MEKIVPDAKRTLFFGPNFSEDDANSMIYRLIKFDASESEDAPIFMKISSNGGNLAGARRLHEGISIHRCPVIGIVAGDAFSAAIIALQACGQRYATKNSYFIIHGASHPLKITLTENSNLMEISKILRKNKKEVRDANSFVLDILEKKMTIKREEIKALMDEGRKINAKEALRFGLIDEIV